MKEHDRFGRFEGAPGWVLHDLLGDLLLAFADDARSVKWPRERIAAFELQRWLADGWARRTLLEIYRELTGLSAHGWREDVDGEVLAALLRALDARELLVFRLPTPLLIEVPFPKQPERPPIGPSDKEDWIGVLLVDAQERPVTGARCEVTPDGGASQERALGEGGRARFGGVSGGTAYIDFPEIDASEWQPGISPSSAGRMHVVEQGDHVAGLAAQSGFRTYKTIWNHPKNAKLASLRASPNALLPGDELFIPNKKSRPTQRATNTEHRFVLQRDALRLRVRITDGICAPMAGAACAVDVGGISETSALDGDGKLDEPIDAFQGAGTIALGDLVLAVSIGTLDPHDEKSGIAARLVNLGYEVSDPSESDFEETLAWAIEEFQCDHGLSIRGTVDAVKDDLEKVYGC
ncbi:hypothetical protein LVJ94_31610 [Pendulispora rubella]|uniref:LysM domain-containing protein n=1 Tax=Pendulispora rubella TaxID=2741070 RepID=A0ABZ2KUM0_9BACT